MDRPLLVKLLLVVAVVLFIAVALGFGGVFTLSLLTGLALGAGGLAAWALSTLVSVL